MNLKRLLFWRKQVDVQKVFDKVIDGGFYSLGPGESDWMCLSLAEALRWGVISPQERREAERAIFKYLGSQENTLQIALERNGLPSSYRDRLKIYRDWANRPKLKRK